MRAFLPPVLALQMIVLLTSGATLRPLSLVVPRCLGVGQRSCASHRYVQQCRCRQDPPLGVARSSVWILFFSLRLP
jgi:hypothetical protein